MAAERSGRQSLILFGGLALSFVVGAALATPFDIDAGAGHALFHFVLGAGLGATSVLLLRQQRETEASWPARLALWSTAVLSIAQLLEAIAAIPDPDGDGIVHRVPNAVSLALLQPLVFVALIILVVKAVRRRAAGA